MFIWRMYSRLYFAARKAMFVLFPPVVLELIGSVALIRPNVLVYAFLNIASGQANSSIEAKS